MPKVTLFPYSALLCKKINDSFMLRFLKNWALPVAMLVGAIGYPVLIHLSFLTPYLLFVMLFVTFCKMSFSKLRPKPLHGWLLLIQVVGAIGSYLLLYRVNKIVAEAVMVCLLCPTATAAAVITSRLGGNAATLTTYTLLSNIMVALIVPVLFPLVEHHPDMDFWRSSGLILSRVFPLLILPFLVAFALKKWMPRLHQRIAGLQDLAFYLWAFSLSIVTAQTLSPLLNDPTDGKIKLVIALAALLCCGAQFFIGKNLGQVWGERISGGQALGQKNTILAIWMAHAYLQPLAAVGPGAYVLWQNLINSWQLWKKRRRDSSHH